ncbi:uncharacterized protein LOC114365877 [Ostrinia furnacalis]|uniref:uncharacterized protein LOC114365877 n=1 Tax=Ostrinia furnacalis TaxID=93504 RepID=UPI00103C8829|nr:uncharacterized protein LOC114365877 [Ostrinia furnacalis]
MPKVQRSPTKTNNADIQRVLSNPNVAEDSQSEPECPKVTSRSKRKPTAQSESNQQSLEERIMDLLASWKKDQDASFAKLTSDIAVVKQQNKDIKKTNHDIEKSLEFLNQSFENMKITIQKMEKERTEIQNHVIELEKKIEDLQRFSRSSTLEIRNMPSKNSETSEELINTVNRTFEAIQLSVSQDELRDVYRLPCKNDQNRTIVVEFRTVFLKNKVLEATRKFNKGRSPADKLNTEQIGLDGRRTPIFIAEHLPGSMRQLFFEARQFAKTYNFKYCWTQNGRIFLREEDGVKSIVVGSMAFLKQLREPK